MMTSVTDNIQMMFVVGGEALHVSILRENIQDQCQLQEAHEDTYWQPNSSESNRY